MGTRTGPFVGTSRHWLVVPIAAVLAAVPDVALAVEPADESAVNMAIVIPSATGTVASGQVSSVAVPRAVFVPAASSGGPAGQGNGSVAARHGLDEHLSGDKQDSSCSCRCGEEYNGNWDIFWRDFSSPPPPNCSNGLFHQVKGLSTDDPTPLKPRGLFSPRWPHQAPTGGISGGIE